MIAYNVSNLNVTPMQAQAGNYNTNNGGLFAGTLQITLQGTGAGQNPITYSVTNTIHMRNI